MVPAHNEEELLPSTLRSLDDARRRLFGGLHARVILVSDASTDGTTALARSLLDPARDVVVECGHRCVGRARALGAAVALAKRDARTIWLASTDADTIVPTTWLTDQVLLARAGARAVAGLVTLGDADRELAQRFSRRYRIAPDRTHTHVHGSNLGMRGDAYVEAGGWRPLHTAEDHDLWDRLRRTGPVLSSSTLTVVTSARRLGRAPCGFAAGLAELDAAGA